MAKGAKINTVRPIRSGIQKTTTLIKWLAGIAVVSCLFFLYSDSSRFKACWILVGSIALSPLLIILLTICFGKIHYRNGIWDYIVGDEGTYSLSRVQGVIWALIIIAFQFETIFALLSNKISHFRYYEPVLSESTIWLLGLTLTSYLAIKGITVNNISQHPELYKHKIKPSWSDLLTGANGLDFSRCQMLLWTFIAVVVYINKCYYYIEHLLREPLSTNIPLLLNHVQDDFKDTAVTDSIADLPFVPFLPWSFIVLMGLSQGVYVGKRLIPNFKLDDVKSAKESQLKNSLEQLVIKKRLLLSLQKRTKGMNAMPGDVQNLQHLENVIGDLENNIAELSKDLKDINELKTA